MAIAEILWLNTEVNMKTIILLTSILLTTGCAVVHNVVADVRLGVQQDIQGFKEDWKRTFGNERSN